ncbi:MAG TPA: 2Fe-2S iron-sulfur cluster-binding protein, partial [bacterium]|nr:2Fe-2S iron-sulfur cluster-binding protein [bacterium]
MAAKTLTIDGKQVSAEEGASVLQVCRDNGIPIPTL